MILNENQNYISVIYDENKKPFTKYPNQLASYLFNRYDLKKKKKIISFIGKLNTSKGYDIFGDALKKILIKYPDWKAKIIGDEKREKINLIHKNADILGFLNHKKVLNIF